MKPLGIIAAALVTAWAPVLAAGDEPVRISVVVVLANSKENRVNPKLETLASEVRKREPALTGFKFAGTLEKSIPVGDSHTFDLPDKQKLKVIVEKAKDEDDRITLTITPPGLGSITYCCSCSKFIPVLTPHKTESGDKLILAVMARPCPGTPITSQPDR